MHRHISRLLLALAAYTLLYMPTADARPRRPIVRHVRVTDIQQYADSLALLRARLDSADAALTHGARGLSSSYAAYDIVTPLTFRHAVAGRLFALKGHGTARAMADSALMAMYIQHPEWVMDTESGIRQQGGNATTPQQPVRNETGMTEEADDDIIIMTPSTDITTPVTLVTKRPNFWKYNGDYSLQFLQNYVSGNWYKGGESNLSILGAATLQANYNDKEKIKWEDKLEMRLGMQTSQGDTLHKYKSTEDLIRLTTKLGVQASHRWYYTLQGIASTQFIRGYKKNNDRVYSDFLSPLKVNLSLGMDYKVDWLKSRLTGSVNISPMAANLKYVDRLALSSSNGIDEGKHSLWDLGSTLTADLTWKFSDMIRLQTRLYGYTTYHRAEVEWENTLTFQMSKYISTKLFVFPRFDDSRDRDDDYGYFQLKEYWSLGFSYAL